MAYGYPRRWRAGEPFAGAEVTRRTFLRLGGGAAAWLAAGMGARPAKAAQAYPDVAVCKGAPEEAVRTAVAALGGMERFVKKGDRVVVKPNMSFPSGPEAASNTDHRVAAAVVALCKEAGAERVLVLDNTLSDAERCMEGSGIRAACELLEPGSVHVLEEARFFASVDIPDAKALDRTDVMRDVLDADVLISVPKAKSHGGTGVSLSLKNMMGLILDRGALHRRGLDEAIVDLGLVLRPALVVLDATTALTTGGPFGPGKVERKDLIIASTDPVAADAQAVTEYQWYGRSILPRQVKHIRLAHERGLGRMDVENLDVRRMEA